LVGALGHGAAYVYVLDDSMDGRRWNLQAKLTANDNNDNDPGCSVAILMSDDSDTAIVGAKFVRNTSTGAWAQQQVLRNSYNHSNDQFGGR